MVVERTIESSTSKTRFPSSTSRNGVYFVCAAVLRSLATLDEGAARIAVADQSLARRELPAQYAIESAAALLVSGTGTTIVSSSIGSRRSSQFQPRQFLAQGGARQVDAAVVQRAGHVGEVDPLEEAMGLPRTFRETLRSRRGRR